MEDDEDYVHIIQSYLQDIPHYQCTVDWEPDFDKALAKVREERISVCFVDYFMGAHNGVELVRAACQDGSNVPFILLTGSTDPDVYTDALGAGASDFLFKEEISATTLSRTIRFALAKANKNVTLRQSQAELQETSRALAEQESLLQLALDHTKHGIALFGARNRLEACNAKYLEIYGFSPEDVHPGLSIEDILRHSICLGNFTEEEAGRILAERLVQVQSAKPSTYHQRLKDGRTIAIVHEPIEEGRSVTTCEDITESLRSQWQSAELVRCAALADAESTAKTKFLSNMSHELRTPLNAIIGFAEAMCLEAFEKQGIEQYKKYATHVLESAYSLLKTVEQVLDMSLIQDDELDIEEKDFSLTDALSETVEKYRPVAQQKQVPLHLRNCGMPIRLHGDRGKITQVVENIIDNAIKFSMPHGVIAVSHEINAYGDAVVTVSDTGSGIPHDQIQSILAPFEQHESVDTRRCHGAGLGLPIAQGLIRLHGGSIQIESATDLGTTVKIMLPAARVLADSADLMPSQFGADRDVFEPSSEQKLTASGRKRMPIR